MEFREYSNPEEADYDITSSLKSKEEDNKKNKVSEYYRGLLMDLIGLLEDIDEKTLQADYGITLKEYFNPNKEVLLKVKRTLLAKQAEKKHSSR